MIVGRVSRGELSLVGDILVCYKQVSRQKINFEKYEISFSSNVSSEGRNALVWLLGVKQVNKHVKILGHFYNNI